MKTTRNGKSVQLKAREIGIDWYEEPNPEMMLELYSDEGLDTEEDMFLFVHGDKNLCLEETNPMTLSDKEWLDYFSGGNQIRFEVKNLYILHGKDGEKDVYMVLNNGIPDWSYSKSLALTGSYDEMRDV